MTSPSHQIFSRRNILQLGVGLLGTDALAALGASSFASPQAPPQPQPSDSRIAADPSTDHHPPSALTPDQALEKLMAGNQRFVAKRRLMPHQDGTRLLEVADGQSPFAAILTCADSRVVPEIAFDQGLGDIFDARVAGNIAITEEVASEEYAVAILKTPLLMVLGHERCGAVDAALKGGQLPGSLNSLVAAIQPAIDESRGQPGDRLTNAIKANVRLQVQRLYQSTVIAAAVEAGDLKVVGAYYELDTGEVSLVS